MLRGSFQKLNFLRLAQERRDDEEADSREMHSICCFSDFGHSSDDWTMFVNLDTRRVYACICNSNSKNLRIHKGTGWIELDVLAAERWLDFAGRSNSSVPANLFKYFPDQFWQKNEYKGDRFHAYALMRMTQLDAPARKAFTTEKIAAIVVTVVLGVLSFNWWFKLIEIIFTLKNFG
jgi:hypothetical protein